MFQSAEKGGGVGPLQPREKQRCAVFLQIYLYSLLALQCQNAFQLQRSGAAPLAGQVGHISLKGRLLLGGVENSEKAEGHCRHRRRDGSGEQRRKQGQPGPQPG